MSDPEIDTIGHLLAASAKGKDVGLDSRAWLRVRDYAISLFEQRAREAHAAAQPPVVEGVVAKPAIVTTARSGLTRSEMRRMERAAKAKDRSTWHVLGRHSRRRPPTNTPVQ